jgi:hypothetical protein
MDRKYDLFEKFSDGSLMWKGAITGLDNALRKLRELAATTMNECCVMHLPDQAVIASLNVPLENDSTLASEDRNADL